jgi:hypothetical protein
MGTPHSLVLNDNHHFPAEDLTSVAPALATAPTNQAPDAAQAPRFADFTACAEGRQPSDSGFTESLNS